MEKLSYLLLPLLMALLAGNRSFSPPQAVIFSILLLFFSSPPSLAATCNDQDNGALLTLQSYLGNPKRLSDWSKSRDCCNWRGVRCDASGRVMSLQIYGDSTITGFLPNSIGQLSNLKYLSIFNLPGIKGPIPSTLDQLHHLNTLILRGLSLSGHILSALSTLQSLRTLDLSKNQLTGTLPYVIFELPKLVYIDLSNNQIAGSIPATIGNLPASLLELHLSRNRLSGNIPSELGNYSCTIIDLSHNQLTGDASALFRRRKRTTMILLQSNLLSFNLGAIHDFPRELVILRIDDNRIYGGIPKQIAKLPSLAVLNVSSNLLCGRIPTKRFGKESYAGNLCLCGGPLEPC